MQVLRLDKQFSRQIEWINLDTNDPTENIKVYETPFNPIIFGLGSYTKY